MQRDRIEVKMYSDFKSPYAFLAFDPAFALEDKYHITLKWKPFQLRLKGKGQRSQYSEYKVKYSYMDARRWANMRGGLMIRGPLKIFDTTPGADRRPLCREARQAPRLRQQGFRPLLQARARGGRGRRGRSR